MFISFSFLIIFIVIFLLFDLLLAHRKKEDLSPREALLWSLFWIGTSVIFNIILYFWKGQKAALDYCTAYLVEKTLSIDNLFVFFVIFKNSKLGISDQRKVLFWGVIGAFFFRGLMILLGIQVLEKFHFMMYIFGVFLIIMGIQMLYQKDKFSTFKELINIQSLYKVFSYFSPKSTHDSSFQNKQSFTLSPLLMALINIELIDIIFAFDSIPAVLSITKDPFIVFSSNIFAILGLRSLYFLLVFSVKKIKFLNLALSLILIFLGCKILFSNFIELSSITSLMIVFCLLSISALISKIKR